MRKVSTSPKSAFWNVVKRECVRLASKPLYYFGMLFAPLFCYFFFTSLMGTGLPTNLPTGIVDMDHSSNSRSIARNLDALQQTEIKYYFNNFNEARLSMQKGKIYGFYYIPENFAQEAQSGKQPTLSFYTNNSFLIAGSLLFRDMKQISELASGSVGRAILYAKGATEEQAMAYLQPIVINTFPIGNPWLNYAVYLCNTIIPGILQIMIFMITVYTIGVEIKDQTAREWLRMGNNSIYISLIGKLLPQTLIFFFMAIIYNVYLYVFLHYPCNSGIFPMIFASFAFVLASQACGVIMIGVLPTLRLGLSFASLWGMLSFSISGFSFPTMAMHPMLQALSNLFPLRHYFMIYVNQALNGYEMIYAWHSYVILLAFIALDLTIIYRLKKALIYFKYIP